MRIMLTKLALLLLMLGVPAALLAQDSSSMTGTVTDATGAVVPGTSVVLSNKLTGVKYTLTTDSKGAYLFPNVPPSDSYTLQFTHAGFSSVTLTSVSLQVGITRTQNAKLLAGSDQVVTVSAANQAVTLNTTDASIGNNLNVEELNDLPVQDRADGIRTLFVLQPGYAADTGSYTGARTDQNYTTIDGIDVNDIAAGFSPPTAAAGRGIVSQAPIDSIEEFRGTVAGLVPSMGTGSGAEFQLVTKSGTNKFHGDLNEYHRDTTTVANTWFNNNVGVPRTPLIRNQFGGAIGGPILKDKLFFFVDINDSRIIQSSSGEQTVPSPQYRAGEVGYIFANAGGTPAGAACSFTSRENTTPQCIGFLTPAQVTALDPQHVGFSPTLLAYIDARYPAPNDLVTAGDGINSDGYRFTQPTPDLLTDYVTRIDYNLTPKQRIFGRLTLQRENRTQALNFLPTDPITSPFISRSYGYVASHIWQISSNKVNQFYYGDNIAEYNFPVNFRPTAPLEFGFGGLSGPYDSFSSQKRRVPIPEVRDDFNWTLGSHNLGFGGTFKFIKTNSNLTNDYSFIGVGLGGNLTTLNSSLRPSNIRGGTTAPGLYDSAFTTALGRLSAITSNYNYSASGSTLPEGTGATRRYRFYQTEAYFGDTWKITKHLTATYGARYQFYSVPYEVNGAESVQNLSFDQIFNARVNAGIAGIAGDTAVPFHTYVLGGKANNGPNLYSPNYKDIAPRVAFAYNPASLPNTVFNLSGGMVYDRTVTDAINFIQDQFSFLFQNSATQLFGQTNANNSLLTDPRIAGSATALTLPAGTTLPTAPAITKPYTPYVSGTTPYGGAAGEATYNVDPHLKDPYSIMLTAGVQQKFQGNFLLKINYAGRFGRRLLAQADASQVVDFTDTASGQVFSNAFGNLTKQLRAGQTPTNQPWFEDVIGPGATQFLVANISQLIQLGDIADFANTLLDNGLTPNNVNVGAQFANDVYFTNKGFSTYHGLLVTLTKNYSNNVQFDVNYTWSHSMDNVSAPANYIAASSLVNFVCEAQNLRACRGNSDFDVQNVISSDFLLKLPVGRGQRFLGTAPIWLEEAVGGWSLSGTPQWRSGVALGALSNAFVAGYNEDAPPIFNGNRSAVATHVHKTSGGSVQMFTDPVAAAAAFTGPIGLTVGSRNNLRTPSAFNMDLGLAKTFPIIVNKLNLKFRADAFNVINHPDFSGGVSDYTSSSFGIVGSTSNSPRVAQFSLRLEF
jgi:hypothetical protein